MISICIPTYNRAPFLKKTLESIVAQFSDPDVREQVNVIILDNQSEDDTEQVVAPFAQAFPNVRYVKDSQKRGLAEGIFKVADMGTGEYLWVLSDDDLHRPHCLKTVLDIVRGKQPDIIIMNMDGFVHENTVKEKNLLRIHDDTFLKNRKEIFSFLNTKFYYTVDYYTTFCSNWVLKKDIFDKHKNIRDAHHGPHDLFPFQSVALYGDFPITMYIISDPILLFRADNASWGKKNPFKHFWYHAALWRHHYKLLVRYNRANISRDFIYRTHIKRFLRLPAFIFLICILILKRLHLFDMARKVYRRIKPRRASTGA